MAEEQVPYLCGGTFFDLLLWARPIGKSRKEQLAMSGIEYKKLDNNNESDVLRDLIRLFYPSGYLTLQKRDVSDFKTCKKSYPGSIPLNDDTEIDAFHEKVRNEYQVVLAKMQKFVQMRLEYESMPKMKRLIKALLTLIKDDVLIRNDEPFYAAEDGRALTKLELLNESNYCVESLLLGIWDYILVNRSMNNELGRATYEDWYEKPDEKKDRWKFVSDIGKTYPRDITIHFCDLKQDAQGQEHKKNDTEKVESEVVDDVPGGEKEKKTGQGKETTQQIGQVKINIGSGSQIDNINELNININK